MINFGFAIIRVWPEQYCKFRDDVRDVGSAGSLHLGPRLLLFLRSSARCVWVLDFGTSTRPQY